MIRGNGTAMDGIAWLIVSKSKTILIVQLLGFIEKTKRPAHRWSSFLKKYSVDVFDVIQGRDTLKDTTTEGCAGLSNNSNWPGMPKSSWISA
jgi:hypothetical protein